MGEGGAARLSFDGVRLKDRPWFPYLCTEISFWRWETRGDPHFNFWAALDGEGSLTCDGQTFRLRPGSFFVFAPGQRISAAHYGGPCITRFSAHFHPLKEGRIRKKVAEFPLLGRRATSTGRLKRQVDAIMAEAVRREDDARLSRLLFDLLAQNCGVPGSASALLLDARVAEAVRRFRESPGSVGSMARLARGLGLSRPHFDRLFTAQMGCPPKQFLLRCRMAEARRLLENDGLRIGEIAERLGYRDIYFFSRQFKERVGLPPAAYRRTRTGETAVSAGDG